MKEILTQIADSVQNGKTKIVQEIVPLAIQEGCTAKEILEEGLLPGMNVVSEKFANKKAFIPEVLISARAMNKGIELIKPLLKSGDGKFIGKVCLGTVAGDLHDIGKNIVKLMMESKNIEVVDLGADVSPESFVNAVKNDGCDLVCCSALLTTTMPMMKEVVDALDRAGVRDKVKIMIGGAPVNEEFRDYIGADIYTDDAATAAIEAEKAIREMHA